MNTGQLEKVLLLQVLVTDLHQRRLQPSEPNLALADSRLVQFFGFSANNDFGFSRQPVIHADRAQATSYTRNPPKHKQLVVPPAQAQTSIAFHYSVGFLSRSLGQNLA